MLYSVPALSAISGVASTGNRIEADIGAGVCDIHHTLAFSQKDDHLK